MTKKQKSTPTIKKAAPKKRAPRKVKVIGLMPKGAWHSGGKIPLNEEVAISANDAKSLIALKHVRRAK